MEAEHGNNSEEGSDEGRIARLIREAHAAVDSGLTTLGPNWLLGAMEDDDMTFFELQQAQKEQMLSEGWTAASDAVPNLPPMRPPPLLPPTIGLPYTNTA